MSDVTRILSPIEEGDARAAEQLLPLVYEELGKLAAQKMALEAPGQTLQATAVVHEAYIRLVDVDKAQHWDSRGHFSAAAAEAMRRILVERARRKSTLTAGGDHERVDLSGVEPAVEGPQLHLLALHAVLEQFELDYREPISSNDAFLGPGQRAPHIVDGPISRGMSDGGGGIPWARNCGKLGKRGEIAFRPTPPTPCLFFALGVASFRWHPLMKGRDRILRIDDLAVAFALVVVSCCAAERAH